tara:strand:+ start:481 stop:753 length:273 start_codon:yes stop_codon:yes gene_type:complete
MKKVILSLVFLLTIGNSLINAKTIPEENMVYGECDNYANISQWAAQVAGLSFGESVGVWVLAYDVCIAYQMEHLVEIEEEELIDPNDDPK